MNKKRGVPPLVRYGVLVVITIVAWIGFETHRELTVDPAPPVPEGLLLPFTPTLDSGALDELQRRISLSDEEIGDTIIFDPIEDVVETEEGDAAAEEDVPGVEEDVQTSQEEVPGSEEEINEQ